MQGALNHSGYICLNGKSHYAYDFVDGTLTLHLYEAVPEIDGKQVLLGHSFDNKQYAFGLQLPLNIGNNHLFPINYNFKVDWVVKNFEAGSEFSQAIFSFAELQYFCPSSSVVEEINGNEVVFKRNQSTIRDFTFTLLGKECRASFIVGSKGKYGLSNSYMQAESLLCIEFDKTGDFSYLKMLYNVVDYVFSFICNRRNTDCTYMELRGQYPSKTLNNSQVVDCAKGIDSQIHFYNKYRENIEDLKIISNTFYSVGILKHIDALFSLVAKDVENGGGFDDATISISSIHPSVMRRMLIDLQQSLQITGAFEFYVRKYLPNMTEVKEHHKNVRIAIEELANSNKFNAKTRKLLKSLLNQIVREPALEDKITKAYYGYEGWDGLETCFENEWFDVEKIKELAHEANAWRNELAHSKREYSPNEMTIKAVRLMEHLNYAIVLRNVGFGDDEIKILLDKMLVR